MRSDLESNKSRGLKLISGKFSTEVQALTGDVTFPEEGTLLHFLDANGADRTVTLPVVKRGLFYIIANTGAANQINIVDSGSNLVTFLRPNESTWLFGADASWTALHAGAAAEVFGAAGVGHSVGLVPDPGAVSGLDRVLGDDGIWHTVGSPGFIDAYKRVSDGIHTAIASGLDQLRLRSSSGAVVPTVTDDDPTYGDVVDFTLDEANIDHDALHNFVANKHIDHTAVSINPGSGLSGGGDISATRTLSFDPHSLTLITPELADEFPFYDVSGAVNGKATFTTINGILDHNALLNYVASRHIDHSAVSIAAGSGLSGGGTIDTTRTLSLDIHGLTADTIATADELPFYDSSGADTNKITFANLNATLDHNSLLNYSANQHVDHTTVSIATAVGTSGLIGGGTIASTRNLSVDINGLTADASPDSAADYVMTYDASALGLKKVLLNKLEPTGAALTKTDDTNVTLTLGGSAASALLAAASITVGWTGTLALSRLAPGTDGQLIVGQTSASPLYKTLSGDGALSAAGALTVTKTGGVAFASSATTDATNASNINSGTLSTARLSSNQVLGSIEFIIDGGGSTITTGVKGYLEVPFACTITQATLLGDQSGSIVVNIWKCTYAQFDSGTTHPVSGDKITASAPPTISAAKKAQDSTLTGWTTNVAAGDILAFNVDSVTSMQRVTLSLKVQKT